MATGHARPGKFNYYSEKPTTNAKESPWNRLCKVLNEMNG